MNIFGGLGVNLGATIYSRVKVQHDKKEMIKYEDKADLEPRYSSVDFFHGIYESSEEYVDVKKKMIVGSVYIPMGLDYRWSLSNDFLKRIHNTFEARPSMSFVGKNAFLSMSYNLGIKVDI